MSPLIVLGALGAGAWLLAHHSGSASPPAVDPEVAAGRLANAVGQVPVLKKGRPYSVWVEFDPRLDDAGEADVAKLLFENEGHVTRDVVFSKENGKSILQWDLVSNQPAQKLTIGRQESMAGHPARILAVRALDGQPLELWMAERAAS